MLGHTKFGTSARHTSFRTRSLGTVSHIQPLSFGPVGLPFQPALLLLLWSSPPESYEQLPKVAPVGAIHQVTSVFWAPDHRREDSACFVCVAECFPGLSEYQAYHVFFFVHNKALFIPVCFFHLKEWLASDSLEPNEPADSTTLFFCCNIQIFPHLWRSAVASWAGAAAFSFSAWKCAATAAKIQPCARSESRPFSRQFFLYRQIWQLFS